MAPPINRRSKENSTISPSIPLPGIALGLFAAAAASFAAFLALRKKRPAKSLQDDHQSNYEGNLPSKENEIEIKEREDNPILITSNGTITISQEPSKLAAGSLKPVFDAIEEADFVQKREEEEEREEAEKGEEEDVGLAAESEEPGSAGNLVEIEKGGETMKKEKTNEEDGEIAEVTVEIEASLAADDASVKALQRSIREKEAGQDEAKAGRKRINGKGNGLIIIKDEDVCNDGERSPTDQQPSPVLINGKKLDFSEKTPDTKDEFDLLVSEGSSISDGVSESSVQELSSMPVRSFIPATEESLEAKRKPGFPIDLNQSGQGLYSPDDKTETAVMDVKGDAKDLDDKTSGKANGLDEGLEDCITNNVTVLCNGSSSLKKLDNCESIGDCEHAVQVTREKSDEFSGLQDKGEKVVDCALINGKNVLFEKSPDNQESVTIDETSLQKGQGGTDGKKFDIHGKPKLLESSQLSSDKTCTSFENDSYEGESADKKACLDCDTSERGGAVESILEQPKPQLAAAQKLDNVDGTIAMDNANPDQEQPNLRIASEGAIKSSELSCEGSADNAKREDMDDGLSQELLAKDRLPTKEQEVGVTTKVCESNDGACETKEKRSMDSTHEAPNWTREADDLILKGSVHKHSSKLKGVSVTKAFKYLPLIGFLCLLMALISYVLWYLDVLPSVSLVEFAETY